MPLLFWLQLLEAVEVVCGFAVLEDWIRDDSIQRECDRLTGGSGRCVPGADNGALNSSPERPGNLTSGTRHAAR